jgi:hypothetical protein
MEVQMSNINMLQDTFKEYNYKIITQVVNMCANIHNFNANETMNTIITSMQQLDNTNENRESIILPPKKKRGRPKKVKTEIVSNSYSTGKTDPILQKLMNAMNDKKDEQSSPKTEIILDDELTADTPIEDDDEIDTEILHYEGKEYLLSALDDVYENIGDNNLIGKWNRETKTIIFN